MPHHVIAIASFSAAVLSSDWRPAKPRTEEDHILRFFDLQAGRMLTEFQVRWDGGISRSCLSPDGSRVYVGCYNVHGFACYCARTGTELWRRKDLKGVQQ